MALSRERIADELLKLLGLPDPAATVAIMIAYHILRPILPEIGEQAPARLSMLVNAERNAGIDADRSGVWLLHCLTTRPSPRRSACG